MQRWHHGLLQGRRKEFGQKRCDAHARSTRKLETFPEATSSQDCWAGDEKSKALFQRYFRRGELFFVFFCAVGLGGGGKWQRISDKRAKAHCWCLAWILQICRGGCGWVGWGKKRIKLRNCMAALNSCKSGRLHWLLKCKRIFLLQLSYWECNLQTAYSITLALLRYLLKNWKEELSWLPCVYFRNQQDQFIRKYNFLHSFLIQCSSLSPVDSR